MKSANTSLRALLAELRTSKATKDAEVQANLGGGGTLRRNHSMELAVEVVTGPPSNNSGTFERNMDFRASTTNLERGTYYRVSNCSTMSEGWPAGRGTSWDQDHRDRDSGRWEREQSVSSVTSSLYGESREGTPLQSPLPGRRTKMKKVFGKLRRAGGKKGSTATIGKLCVCV